MSVGAKMQIYGAMFIPNLKKYFLFLDIIHEQDFIVEFTPEFKSLAGLKNLEYLSIRLARLFDTSFRNLINLKHLSVCQCDFKGIDSQTFRFIPNLEVLKMREAKNHDHMDFSYLKHLKWLEIGGMKTFREDKFLETISNSLEVLYLSSLSNIDTFIDALVKSSCRPSVMHVVGSKINHFDAKSLRDLTNLKHLGITHSSLKTINLDYDSLSNLESIDLLFGCFQELNLSKTINLTELSLSYNHNINFHSNFFSGLKHLEILRLRNINGNPNDHPIVSTVFEGLDNLRILDLSFNLMKTIDPNVFSHTPKLERLDLSFNKLSNLNTEMFQYLNNLKYLNLSKNEIRSIKTPTFDHLENIECLCLNLNSIACLDLKIFKELKKLEFLFLNHNHFDIVKPTVFTDLPQLKQVILDQIDLDNQEELKNYFKDSKVSFIFNTSDIF